MELGAKVTRQPKKKKDTKWEYLTNYRVVECIDRLLRGEAVSQLENNCDLSRIPNIITELRSLIGFHSIENYRIIGRRAEAYKLVNSDEVRQRLKRIKDVIIKRIEAKAS
jgi:hypothetical protein